MPPTINRRTIISQLAAFGLRLLLVMQALSPDQRSFSGLSAVSAAPVGKERTVYWNASNPLFQPSGENVLHVNTLDRINFVCPNNGLEYYKVYWTASRDNYLACTGGNPLFNCRTMDSYLVIVQIFAADPTAPVFLTPVYFYSPSTGQLSGLDQTAGGACQTRNLRVTVRTDPATAEPDPGSPLTTTAASATVSATAVSNVGSSVNETKTTAQAGTTAAGGVSGRGGTQAVTSGDDKTRKPGVTTAGGNDSEHPDYSRMSNLITGSGVAMPTTVAVAALACLSVLLLLSGDYLT